MSALSLPELPPHCRRETVEEFARACEAGIFGHRYVSVTRHADGDIVSPLASPDASIAIADLFP